MRYRYHWLFKLLALVLAVVSGGMLILGCAGLVMDDLGYYERSRRSQLYNDLSGFSRQAAKAVFDRFAWEGTDIEPKLFERFFRWGADVDAVDSLEYDFFYTIRDQRTGQTVAGTAPENMDWDWIAEHDFDVRRGSVTEMPKAEYYPTFAEFTVPPDRVYLTLEGEPLPELGVGVTAIEYYVVSEDENVNWQNVYTDNYHHSEAGGADYTIYRMEYTGYDSYQVGIFMTNEQTLRILEAPVDQEFLPRMLAQYRELLAPMAIWGGIVLLLSVLWLALTAGGSPHRDGIRPEGLNQIPLDIYLALSVCGGVALVALLAMVLDQMVWSSGWGNYDAAMESFYADAVLLALCGMGAGGIVALFFMACAAQMKVGKNYWLKHTALGLTWRYGWKIAKKIILWCWSLVKKITGGILRVISAVGHICRRFIRLLPLCWQWLLASGILWMLMFFGFLMATRGRVGWLLFGAALTILLVLYGTYCFGTLRDGAKKISGGDLDEKVDSRYLLGCFGEFAGHLNTLGDACVIAAREQMKSERMKSELITNVSHDIKTPLTSIINYVDLLQKTDDEAQRREYMEVLDRQSQRLKKLIEDLMEMSRANSGNMAVEITPTDVCEAVNQALGEFSDTLENCGLTLMRKAPDQPVMALCDGRHLWRVLGNCLGNVVKYALPGTRVYVEIQPRDQKVEISIKNISARMLNITAEELMERFVRGDSSRNTEGNGLGLNIAKSLMELQGGRLDLVVDGDLFKVVLTLNAA